MAVRLLMLVLDGFSPRHCTSALTPNLVAIGEAGAWARAGGRSVLPSITYPNHASLVTGLTPQEHGIFANQVFTEDGLKPAKDIGVRGTFLDAAREAGLDTAIVTGDARILGVVGGARCDNHWPPGGALPPGTPTVRGYAADAAAVAGLNRALDGGADVVLCQLDNTDGVSHLHGPDSPEAMAQYAAVDALVGELVENLRRGPRWSETIAAVISDHSQVTADSDRPPISVSAALGRAGIAADVIEDGSCALLRATQTEAARRAVAALDGVAGVEDYAPGVLYAHALPGRGFATGKPLTRGLHGCPASAPTLCMAVGGHPGMAGLRRAFDHEAPTTATLPRLLTDAVGLAWR
jgi:predicted AlkP superfamily pyrophosphatase or phosphodiesterase